jgi:2-succinyl-5-enolpyruvyl-6-hydroxy-3-cyclohexene-1-carboxylate synthase
VADPEPLAAAARAALPAPRAHGDWTAAWTAAERRARAALDDLLDKADQPSEPRTARDLADILPDGALLLAGSSMPVRDLDLTMRPREGLRVLANRGASGIDGFVSTAIGAAQATGAPTAALLGDLTLLHDHNGLLIPPGSPRPDLVLVVADNDGGGIFSLLPQAGVDHFEQVFGTPHGADLEAMARAVGWNATRLAHADDLPILLTDLLAEGGPHLIRIPSDRAANARLHMQMRVQMHETLTPGEA